MKVGNRGRRLVTKVSTIGTRVAGGKEGDGGKSNGDGNKGGG